MNPGKIRELRARDIPAKRARKEWELGIAMVNQLFREDRLLISGACRKLIAKIQALEFDGDETRPPRGQDDHLTDALRYLVYSVLRKGEY